MRSDQNPKVATFVGSTIPSTLLDGVQKVDKPSTIVVPTIQALQVLW